MLFAFFVLFTVPVIYIFQCSPKKSKVKPSSSDSGSSGDLNVRTAIVSSTETRKNRTKGSKNDIAAARLSTEKEKTSSAEKERHSDEKSKEKLSGEKQKEKLSGENDKEKPPSDKNREKQDSSASSSELPKHANLKRLDRTQCQTPTDPSKAPEKRSKHSGRQTGVVGIEKQKDILVEGTQEQPTSSRKGNRKAQSVKSQRDNRAKWAINILDTTPKTLAKEFMDKVKKYAAPGLTSDAHKANENKNRYADVRCLDQTRVVLKNRKKGADYIHGSYVTIPEQENKYICTQGPLPETVDDFWWMVVQEKAAIIIQLCNFYENNSEKCSVYWPNKLDEEVKYGSVMVRNVEAQEDFIPGTIKTILNVTGPNYCTKVTHLFMTDWPDHLAPAEADHTLAIYRWVKANNPAGIPVIVHCSAGVGRTSTFVGIDYANVRIANDPDINLADIVKEMRAQRFQAMQSHVQYIFLVVCLLEYFVQEKLIQRDEKVKKFMENYRKYSQKKVAKLKNKEKPKEKE